MNTIVRVALLFKNPSAVELIQLSNVIWVGKSLEQQDIVVQLPETLSYTVKDLSQDPSLDLNLTALPQELKSRPLVLTLIPCGTL